MWNPESTVRPLPESENVTIQTDVTETDSQPATEVQQLGAILPSAKSRKIAYAIYAGAALLVGNAAVGLAAAEIAQPVWLVVASAVVANLAAPFAALAIANAKK